jgi:hypothetical protein
MKKLKRNQATPLFSAAERNASRRNVVAMNKAAVRAIKKRGGSSLLLSFGPPHVPTGYASPLVVAKPTVSIAPEKSSANLLRLKGHSPGCVALRKSGEIASCDCRSTPFDDPAFAVAMVVHHARMAMAQRAPLPLVILELLSQRLNEGDPACKVVASWLERCGLIRVSAVLSLSNSRGGRR